MDNNTGDAVARRIQYFTDRVRKLRENDLYFYNSRMEEIKGGAHVVVKGGRWGCMPLTVTWG